VHTEQDPEGSVLGCGCHLFVVLAGRDLSPALARALPGAHSRYDSGTAAISCSYKLHGVDHSGNYDRGAANRGLLPLAAFSLLWLLTLRTIHTLRSFPFFLSFVIDGGTRVSSALGVLHSAAVRRHQQHSAASRRSVC
jgi:hypothetical protein